MTHTLRSAAAVLVVLAAVAVGLLAGDAARGDDRDLLRTTGARPYVFFMIDTSSSMNASFRNGLPLPLNGDDPESKIFAAKKAVYEVFSDATEFNYGMATYDQDQVRVLAKHWLYAPLADSPFAGSVAYPTQDDQWVFGPLFRVPDNDLDVSNDATMSVAGTCADPYDVNNADDRRTLNRLARGGLDATDTVYLWLTDGADTYRMTVTLPVGEVIGDQLVDPTLHVNLALDAVDSCSGPSLTSLGAGSLDFETVGEFLYNEAASDGSAGSAGGLATEERFVGSWDQQDVRAEFDCGSNQPFSGKGWEGNYDERSFVDAETGLSVSPNTIPSQLDVPGNNDPQDHFCAPKDNPSDSDCYNVRFSPTFVRDEGRNVDRGDMLPFDWDDNNHAAFLKRLNPNHGTGLSPDYGVATYFQDRPNSGSALLRLDNASRRPLIAAGGSPFAKAINDFRCWYSEKRSGQCKNARYPESWELLARREIGNEAGCIQPYQILITDGENICGGESPAADTAALRSQANVRTWVIALAPDGSLDHGLTNAIVKNGKGELIYAENEDKLREALENIRAIIEEEKRTFASAAVPTVQATVADRIYVSNFTPVNSESVWPGTVLSFLKPLPLDDQGRPDATDPNFLWSAGDQLLLQTSGLGVGATKRRVYYSQSREENPDNTSPIELLPVANGDWGDPAYRKLLAPTSVSAGDPATTLEKDLWLGFGIPFVSGNLSSEDTARTRANDVLASTYAVKTTNVEGIGDVDYLMGDVFHSDPVIVGSPASLGYFADNVNDYREFARIHENRRKVLLVGTNDGMLHAFDAGVAGVLSRTTGAGTTYNDIEFDAGSGRELFAFVPRPMLGELRDRAETSAHDWGLDGTVKVADVYIDVVYDPQPDAADREWRTVVVGGFRRGAPGYYALDITHPDKYKEVQVGLPQRTTVIQDANNPLSASPPPRSDTRVDSATLPSCADTLGGGGDALDCHDEVNYPAPLWEFQDTVWDDSLGQMVALDEGSANGEADLANSWSIPNIGRLRICDGSDCVPSTDPANPDDLVDRYVAVFGGGLPVSHGDWGKLGNWIYVVDIETGETLYKREVFGSVAAEPAAVDTDNDGYLDRIYFGTTDGFLYRVNLVEYDVDGSGNRTLRPFPNLEDTSVRDINGNTHTVQRIPLLDVDGDPVWAPIQIFDTVAPLSASDSTPVARPLFLRPSVLFVAELGTYALSFGTGDREDLWRPDLAEGRFYTFVDDSDNPSVTLPMTETGLRRVALADTNIDLTDPSITEKNFLVDRTTPGTRGWYLVLDSKERMINPAFNLAGVTFFVTFEPRVFSEAGECSREGDSRIFGVNTTNGNGLLRDVNGNRVRYVERKAFATEPFTEQSQTKNPITGTGEPPGPGGGDECSGLEDIANELKTLLPANCKFSYQQTLVKTVLSNTEVTCIAPIPLCIIEKNWKEFDY